MMLSVSKKNKIQPLPTAPDFRNNFLCKHLPMVEVDMQYLEVAVAAVVEMGNPRKHPATVQGMLFVVVVVAMEAVAAWVGHPLAGAVDCYLEVGACCCTCLVDL